MATTVQTGHKQQEQITGGGSWQHFCAHDSGPPQLFLHCCAYGRIPAENILCSAAVLLSGHTHCKIMNFLKIPHVPFIGPAEYYHIQSTYLHPVIDEYWTIHQTAILSVLCDQRLRLIGDGRSDS